MAEHRERTNFRPRARLLLLLGDQLIRDVGVAVFELVKNAYDANASRVTVHLDHVTDPGSGRIVVDDDGDGMTEQIVREVWLEPGTDFRQQQRAELIAAATEARDGGDVAQEPIRLPLGEKGVGRFAAHKLGDDVEMTTRAEDASAVRVHIDWTTLDEVRYLEDAAVDVEVPDAPRVAGTTVTVTQLRNEWSRRRVRELHRSVTSIQSPFAPPGDFEVELLIDPPEDRAWTSDLLSVRDSLDIAPFIFEARLTEGVLAYEYAYRPPPGLDRVPERTAHHETRIGFARGDEDLAENQEALWRGLGVVGVRLFMFDLDAKVLQYLTTDRKGLRDLLRQSGGVRVYRDGIRVYDYGEPGDDWLNLDQRRINAPTARLANNQVFGEVSLRLGSSSGLVEKTNREGFIENDTYRLFHAAVAFAVQQAGEERSADKERIRRAYSQNRTMSISDELDELRGELSGLDEPEPLLRLVDGIDQQFTRTQERLMTAASAGLSLAMVVHEVEKGINALNTAVRRQASQEEMLSLAGHLDELIDGLAFLTRKSDRSEERASELIRIASFNLSWRLRHHKIELINALAEPSAESSARDFRVKLHRRLAVATLMNLVDNSIWWLRNTRSDESGLGILMTTSSELGGASIILADDGPGFLDPPEQLVEPFASRRPDGMGLGLHLANQVLEVDGGRLMFPSLGDLNLGSRWTGAIVALNYPEATWLH